MPKSALIAVLLLLTLPAVAGELRLVQSRNLPPLPVPVTNNAVVAVAAGDTTYLVSFAGLGAGKTHDDTHARTFVLNSAADEWQEGPAVPEGEGRLAAVAATAGGSAYVFGGYTVAEDGVEVSLPYVYAFDPVLMQFDARAPMPVPVDDAVAVAYQDRFIYLVSGWHDFGNVNLVQRYDTRTDSWSQATPTPGPAVFGHAGGIVDDRIVYCDGVAVQPYADRRRDFVAVDDCYLGIIDGDDGRRIDWRTVPAHPGRSRYRMAAAGIEVGVLFVGGSDNPYNYNGIGYDGNPSEPVAGGLLFMPLTGTWHAVDVDGLATMDHRGLVSLDSRWLTLGGMVDGQQVTDAVNAYALDRSGPAQTP